MWQLNRNILCKDMLGWAIYEPSPRGPDRCVSAVASQEPSGATPAHATCVPINKLRVRLSRQPHLWGAYGEKNAVLDSKSQGKVACKMVISISSRRGQAHSVVVYLVVVKERVRAPQQILCERLCSEESACISWSGIFRYQSPFCTQRFLSFPSPKSVCPRKQR